MGYIKTTRNLLLAVTLIEVPATCRAQLNGLTLRESEEILETLPMFKAAERRGECPGFVPGPSESPDSVWLQMRGFCPPDGFHGSTTIEAFQVNRFSGVVTEWPSGHSVAGPSETAALTRTLVAGARARILSEHEAECLAREAVRDSLIPREAEPMIEKKGREGMEILFLVRVAQPQPAIKGEWRVSVDTGSLAIFADGERIDASTADAVMDRMRTMREPLSISLPETIELARRVPSILSRIEATCSAVVAAEYGTANKRFVTLEDGCQPPPRSLIVLGIIDTLTGAITQPGTDKVLTTPETTQLAGEFLSRAGQRRAVAAKEIEKVCAGK
jgi:hypothetical protein